MTTRPSPCVALSIATNFNQPTCVPRSVSQSFSLYKRTTHYEMGGTYCSPTNALFHPAWLDLSSTSCKCMEICCNPHCCDSQSVHSCNDCTSHGKTKQTANMLRLSDSLSDWTACSSTKPQRYSLSQLHGFSSCANHIIGTIVSGILSVSICIYCTKRFGHCKLLPGTVTNLKISYMFIHIWYVNDMWFFRHPLTKRPCVIPSTCRLKSCIDIDILMPTWATYGLVSISEH